MSDLAPILNTFASRESLLQALSRRISEQLLDGIADHGKASMVVSGGSTPKRLFDLLSQIDLPWEKVTVSLVDERWVDPGHEDSNEHLVNTYLLKDKAADAKFIGLKNEALSAKAGEAQCREALTVLDGPFDVVILGMGEDGHTASFFPDAEALGVALTTKESCVAITPPVAPYERMTLSRDRLLQTRSLLLHIEGASKHEVLIKALQTGAVETMPIRAMITQDVLPLEVYYTKEKR